MALSDSVQDVINRAREVYLNDVSGATYTNTVLLPYVKQAYDDVETEFELNNLGFVLGIALIKVPANTLILAVPGNFLYPVELKERNWGSTSQTDYSDMSQRDIEPTREKTDRLINWAYREGTVHFVGATTDREVKLSYQQAFPRLLDGQSLVRGECLAFMSAKVAAYAHMFIAQNSTLADVANKLADGHLTSMILANVKKVQSLGVRRRPYRPFTR